MSLSSIFAPAFGQKPPKSRETVDYDTVFKGEAHSPVMTTGDSANFLPGLRSPENDVDAYFKDVFDNPVY